MLHKYLKRNYNWRVHLVNKISLKFERKMIRLLVKIIIRTDFLSKHLIFVFYPDSNILCTGCLPFYTTHYSGDENIFEEKKKRTYTKEILYGK